MVFAVAPNVADPAVHRFVKPNLIVYDRGTPASAELLLFLPGTAARYTGVKPFPQLREFFDTAADAGYRVIALQYDNYPWIQRVCARNPDPECAAKFHEKRLFGENVIDAIDDTPEEAIVHRLVKLLEYLDREHPGEGWGGYLEGGRPKWSRIAVAGHSQGASMAAFLGKREALARVVLLSGPADFMVPDAVLAPWLSWPSATPPERWYAMYHAQERQAGLLRRACEALAVPPGQIRVENREPIRPPNAAEGVDLYHVSIVGDRTTPRAEDGTPLYRNDWAFLLGRSPGAADATPGAGSGGR